MTGHDWGSANTDMISWGVLFVCIKIQKPGYIAGRVAVKAMI